MRNFLTAALFSLLLSACVGDDEANTAATDAPAPHKISDVHKGEVADVADARTKIDWAGTYQGILPCQKCDGVSTMLVLSPSMNYTLRTQMLGVDLKDKVTKGKFHWMPDNSAVVLEGNAQLKVFRIFPTFGEFRLPNGRPIPAENREQLRLQKTN